jgi:hypothetical protein
MPAIRKSAIDQVTGFDRNGLVGPTLSFLCQAQKYPPEHLALGIKIIQENAEKLAQTYVLGRKELIRLIQKAEENQQQLTIEQLMATRFFQDLQVAEPYPKTYEAVKEYIAPAIFENAANYLPEYKDFFGSEENKNVLIPWLAGLLSLYITKEEIENECKYQEFVKVRPNIKNGRIQVGEQIYATAQAKNMSEKGFEVFLTVLKSSFDNNIDIKQYENPSEKTLALFTNLEKNDKPREICKNIYNYLAFFDSAGRDKTWLGPYVTHMLERTFREKFYPKSDADKLIPIDPRGGTGAVLALMFRANHYTAEELSRVAKAAKRNYTFISRQEVHGRKAFCHMFELAREEKRTVSIQEILASQLFQEMRPEKFDSQSHELASLYLAPSCIETAKHYMPEIASREFSKEEMELICDRLASVLESCFYK